MEREGNSTKSNKTKKETHTQEKANFLSNLFFCWTIPIFINGYKRELDENDLHGCLKSHESHMLGTKLEAAWFQERSRGHSSLTRAIWKVFRCEICSYGILSFIMEFGIKLAHPLCLGRLMQYYTEGQTLVSKNEALIYGSSIILLSFLSVILGHNYMMGTQHLGMKIRVACSSLIYRKCLRLNKTATGSINTGKIINLLANDLGRFDNIFLSFHNIWAAPLQIIIITVLLYLMMGLYALAGIGFFVLFIPVQVFLGKKTSKYRLKTAEKTDERMRLINELINGMEIIKMYTWEKPYEKLMEKTRKWEIKQIRSVSMVRAINASVSMFLNRAALYFAVLVYTLAGNVPQAYYVFVVSSFYNVLRQPIVFHIPQAISTIAESSISIKRIKDFLLLEEIVAMPNEVNFSMKTTGIFLHDVSATWDPIKGNVLSDVNFNARKNELIAIVGPVGNGKSSIFQVILKELPITKGALDVNGKISYTSQEPWLFSGTIKENILFASEMNSKRYQEVCRVCALEKDLSSLPQRDETIVGDRGITLSGGQKARISLARAVYKDADIYLLDDPLSAVDTHVGKQLFSNCILDFLKEKCVVLITHQLQYLKNTHRIYVIKNGNLKSCDSFSQFGSAHKDVVSILNCEQNDDADEEEFHVKEQPVTINKPETKEHKHSGSIDGRVYNQYIRAGGGYFIASLVILLFFVAQLLAGSVDYFVTYWVNLEELKLNKSTVVSDNIFIHRNNCIYLYSLLISSITFITILRSTSFMQFCMKASKRLYDKMARSILNTGMTFFYGNTSGRILNRFSKDMGLVDETLPLIMLEAFQVLFNVTSITSLVAIVNPWMMIPTVIIVMLFYWMKIFFLASSQNLKRLEATARSPVFTHLTDSMQGLTTVRALGVQNYLIRDFETKQNMHNSAFYLFMACNRTFGFWLDFQCAVYVGIVITSVLLMLDQMSGGNVGLAITQSLALTGMLQWGIRQWSEMENQMTAVERVVEYAELEPETDPNDNTSTPTNWIRKGCIELKNVSLKYSSEELFAIKNISVTIKAKEKVGIVGRTGAGKSSLVTALFRLVEPKGTILIDDTDTKTVPLHLLRSKISIIPQDPIILHGSLRRNLDPFDEYKDDQLWAVLKEVKLDNLVQELPGGLYGKVFEGGSNFSVGQRQLLCIARALIRNNNILILDEATSNVDAETDEIITSTIRKKFSQCTVITIAHRLRTVMDSDKILVLDSGSAAEFDHPYILLQNESSTLYALLSEMEDTEVMELTKIAEENFKVYSDNKDK